jgi:hypothetical protein
MHKECDQGSCMHEQGHHGHTHSHSYQPCNCCCCCHSHSECHQGPHKYSEILLQLADEAWMEVVKEKIKEEILKQSGQHLNQLAKLVSTSNHIRWKEKMAEKKNVEDFEESLRDLMRQQHSKSSGK